MLNPDTLGFLRKLDRNNTKDWFDRHRDPYEAAHNDLLAATETLRDCSDRYDPRVAKANPDIGKCLTRIRRDPRFSKGKPPFKTDFFLMLNPTGNRQGTAGYFLHVEPGNCYAGASYFVTQPEPLGRIRDQLVARFEAWQNIVEGREVRKVFPQGVECPSSLKRVPRGYDPEDPGADYLRMKGFGLHHRIADKALVSDGGLDLVIESMKAARPFVDFINTAIAGGN